MTHSEMGGAIGVDGVGNGVTLPQVIDDVVQNPDGMAKAMASDGVGLATWLTEQRLEAQPW